MWKKRARRKGKENKRGLNRKNTSRGSRCQKTRKKIGESERKKCNMLKTPKDNVIGHIQVKFFFFFAFEHSFDLDEISFETRWGSDEVLFFFYTPFALFLMSLLSWRNHRDGEHLVLFYFHAVVSSYTHLKAVNNIQTHLQSFCESPRLIIKAHW